MRGHSKCDSLEHIDKLIAKYKSLGHNEETVHRVLKYIAEDAPMIIHVRVWTIEKLLGDTCYRSAFETNVRGDAYMASRIKWESECFHKLYDGVIPFERPKYGAPNLLSDPAGVAGARAYGNCYMVLRPQVRKRITIASADTSTSRCLGVLDFCAHVVNTYSDEELRNMAEITNGKIPFAEYKSTVYKEIQIHGDIDITRDVSALHIPRGLLKSEIDVVDAFQIKFNIDVIEF
jgi:hypothetical protein